MRRAILFVGLLLCSGRVMAQVPAASQAQLDLKQLSLEELANIIVTSVSRGEQRLSDAPAAVAVVTSGDIRRSGATSVPEALRAVPGLHVARQTSSIWAVSSRGFSSTNSEKLLVLSDTRSIYTPLFSGVFWDVQDYLLEDIERIEVIRGPGAALWGSNAVNGVINITTKNARDTQGFYADTSAGSEEQFAAGARYGGRLGSGAYYRVFGKYADRDQTMGPAGIQRDDWQIGHGGFRADWDASTADSVTLQGEAYRADAGQLVPSVGVIGRPGPAGVLRVRASGGNVLARWRHRPSDASDLQVRVYYDRTHRNDPAFVDNLDTIDVDVQHRVARARRHEITWGANYRFTSNRNSGLGVFAVDPPDSRDQLIAGFVQDQIRLRDSLHLTVGTKVEHNDFSGAEIQPGGRVAWQPSARQTVWGAISRAVRVPTRLERDIAIDVTDPAGNPVVRLLGDTAFEAERLVAYEAGYRWQPHRLVSFDVAAFHNRYEGLASLEQGIPFTAAGRTVVPIVNQNLTAGRTTGFEALVTATPTTWWRLSGSSSTLGMSLDPTGADLNRGAFLDGSTPRHQLGIRSAVDLGRDVQVDALFRRLSAIRRSPQITTGDGLPGYAELDLRLGWRRWQQVEISLAGQNLLHGHHAEFGAAASRGEIERGVYVRLTWRR
jgi:iron complex outermembrane receptor protein